MRYQTPWFDIQLTGLKRDAGWTCDYTCSPESETVCVAGFRFHRDRPERLPAFQLEFQLPWRDMQIQWHPRKNGNDCHHFFPYWQDGGKTPYSITHNQLLYVFADEAGINRFALACSECRRSVLASCGVGETTIECKLYFQTTASDPEREFAFEIRFDRRALQYDTIVDELSRWQSRNDPAAPVPESAGLPVYSTWYQFQKGVSQAKLEEELPFAAAAGLKTVILDDGWQCAGDGGGDDISNTGEWLPDPEKFPDLAGFVTRCGRYGMNCLLWIGLPFVGRKRPAVYRKFAGKYLVETDTFGILDPRFPEVRRHLIGVCRRLMRDYGLAGLKVDFIDQMHLFGRKDPMEETGLGERDSHSLEAAIDQLLDELYTELRAIREDVLIEFRQFYCGPAARRCCNILRAQDCPGDQFQNRMRTIDLRLISTQTAIHSDMMIWNSQEKPVVILRQLLNTLFSVPQISVRLADLPEESRLALAAYLKFTREYREILQRGRLHARHPEQCYPLVSCTLGDETLIAVYAENQFIEFPLYCRKLVLVNASCRDGILLRSGFPATTVRIFELSGRMLREETYPCGVLDIPVPSTSYAILEPVSSSGLS